MGVRENLQKLIDRKQQEISTLEVQIREAHVYLQAVQDSMKALPRDSSGIVSGEQRELRPGTDISKTRDLLRAAGKPMHISEIVKALGKANDKKNRLSLGGSISGYVRDGQIFSRPAPNTFGLLEFENGTASNSVPESFGKV